MQKARAESQLELVDQTQKAINLLKDRTLISKKVKSNFEILNFEFPYQVPQIALRDTANEEKEKNS